MKYDLDKKKKKKKDFPEAYFSLTVPIWKAIRCDFWDLHLNLKNILTI